MPMRNGNWRSVSVTSRIWRLPGAWCWRICVSWPTSRGGYLGYGLPLADLIQEGNIGLMKAVKRYDPDVGVRLVSFAVH